MTKTKIPWADYSWNPSTGCSRASEGCDYCYAERMAKRFHRPWGGAVYHPTVLFDVTPRQKPAVIFCCSTSDLFFGSLDRWDVNDVRQRMGYCHQHTFIVLTKRPQNIPEFFRGSCIPPNVWLGISAENQARYDERWPVLCAAAPKGRRLVSIEPMLGEVQYLRRTTHTNTKYTEYPDWVIAGPETGSGARLFKDRWIEDIQDQCRVNEIPFFDKRYIPDATRQFPEGMRLRKDAGGAL